MFLIKVKYVKIFKLNISIILKIKLKTFILLRNLI